MLKDERNPTRGRIRAWLKMTIDSGLLDELPPRGEADDGGSKSPRRHAQGLLAELHDPGASPRTLAEILDDVRRFRSWVEGERKRRLKLTLAERPSGNGDRGWLEDWSAAMTEGRNGGSSADETASPPRPARKGTPTATSGKAGLPKSPKEVSREDTPRAATGKSDPLSNPLWDRWIDGA